jgi:hypothetical protein
MTAKRGKGIRGGFTLIEMVIVLTMLIVISGVLVNGLGSLRRFADTGSVQSQLQILADRAMVEIIGDLRRSGFVTVGGVDYPHLFDDGMAGDYVQHDHDPAAKEAEFGDPDFGPNREIVFSLPADADANGVPDVDAGGNLEWDVDEFSYVVNTGPDGVNYLERRVNGAVPSIVTHHVERLVFDDNDSSVFAVPLDSIRVRVDFRMEDGGRVYTHTAEATVRLRNGVLED